MADSKINTTAAGSLAQAIGAANNSTTGATKPKSSTAGLDSDAFLNLLVNQMQHQDPLNPMDSQQMGAQLAQFTSVEQLININNKLDKMSSGTGTAASMVSFIGKEVTLKDQDGVNVKGGVGPNLSVNLGADIQSVRVDLTDSNGGVAESINFDNIQAGKNVIQLSGLNARDGNYVTRVVGVDSTGRFTEIPHKITGTVDGFVLEPEPKLLVGSQELDLADISEVHEGPVLL